VIPDSFKQNLLNRVDIFDVVSNRVALKKSGANWAGLCPFHSEKTPSFTVSQSKQFYHCFGCGAHGNAIGFLMEYAGLGYIDALRELASSVGLKLPESSPNEARSLRNAEPDLHELLQQAARYYRERLKESQRAIDYLKHRGLTGPTAARYGIGYAPGGWQNLGVVFRNYEESSLVDCGLVVEKEGKRYDRFRDRIMFPILNQRGLVVGFGGRVIVDDGSTGGDESVPASATEEGKEFAAPKYLNSPETPLFEKGRELYGLPQARAAIRSSNRIVVVEGYMDVVMLAQHGVENVVATLGTAATPTHLQKLLRQADDVVFCFDGDDAGRRAAWRALEVSLDVLSDRKAIRFLFLPAEHDPDSFVRGFGREAFERMAKEAEPLSAFLLSGLSARVELATLEGRSRLIAEAKPLVRRVAAPAMRVQLVRAFAKAASMTPEETERLMELGSGTIGKRERPAPPEARTALALDARVERELLACLLAAPELAREFDVECLDPLRPEASTVEEVARWIRTQPAVGTAGGVLEAFRGSSHEANLAAAERVVLEHKLERESAAVILRDAEANLLNRRNRSRLAALAQRIEADLATEVEKDEYARLSVARPTLTSAA
jgi:DNA primase